MAKNSRKQFTVQKRYLINVATKVTAKDFDEAVVEGRKLQSEDFTKTNPGVDLYDCEEQPGFGVTEIY